MSIGSGRILARREPELHSGGLPLLGRLKVGIKVKGPKGEYPASIDWFRATGKYEKVFHEVYGEKPNNVQIVFFSDDPKDVCSERYVVRDGAGKLLAEGDGESWRVWSTKSAAYVFVPKHGDKPVTALDIESIYCTDKSKAKMSIELTLSFILIKIPAVWGQWSLTTRGSKSSIPAIRSTFDLVKEKLGFVKNVPFDLLVEKVRGTKPGEKSVFPVVTLVPNVSQANMDLLSQLEESNRNKIRGLLTESRIRAIVGDIEEDEPRPAIQAIAAQAVPDRLSLPAAAEEQCENYGGTEDESTTETERDTQTMGLPLDDEPNDGVDGDTEEKE